MCVMVCHSARRNPEPRTHVSTNGFALGNSATVCVCVCVCGGGGGVLPACLLRCAVTVPRVCDCACVLCTNNNKTKGTTSWRPHFSWLLLPTVGPKAWKTGCCNPEMTPGSCWTSHEKSTYRTHNALCWYGEQSRRVNADAYVGFAAFMT